MVGECATLVTSSNGGWALNPFVPVTMKNLFAIKSCDEQKSLAVGWNGALIFTTNNGKKWFKPSSKTTMEFHTVFFIDKKFAWVAGEQGEIICSKDSGRTWSRQQSNTGEWLHSIYFCDSLYGVCTGNKGVVINTFNGGVDWFVNYLGFTDNIRSIFLKNDYTGLIVGDNGFIIDYDVYHNAFLMKDRFTDENLNSVNFCNGNWYITGDNGSIYKSKDDGDTWQKISVDTKLNLRSVFFLNDNFGWIAGDSGIVFKSTDAGATWTIRFSGTVNDLRSVYFLNDTLGYIAGLKGTILKYINSKPASVMNETIQSRAGKEFLTNFPNPFNSTTTIKYYVDEAVANVNLSLYDILGRKISELLSGQKTKGIYTYSLNCSQFNLSSGIYFIRLKINSKTEFKKLVLLK